MALLRAYQEMPNGVAMQTGAAYCTQRKQLVPAPLTTTPKVLPVSQVRASKSTYLITKNSAMNPNLETITPAENQIGALENVRKEFMQGAGSTVRTYQIGFTNGSGADVTAYIGDGNTIAYEANSGTPLPGTVTITGTWGANSLAIWKLTTSHTPVRVDKIRLNFDATTYLNTAQLTGIKTRPDAIVTTDNYNLSTWISPNQFQSLIIENPTDLRILWDASFALSTLIPNGRSVTFTLYYVSVADTHLMRRVNG